MNVEQLAHKHSIEILHPSFSEHLYTIALFDRAYPLDVTAIKHSNSFRHNLMVNIMFLDTQLRAYNNAKTHIENLIEEIEKELGPGASK